MVSLCERICFTRFSGHFLKPGLVQRSWWPFLHHFYGAKSLSPATEQVVATSEGHVNDEETQVFTMTTSSSNHLLEFLNKARGNVS